MDELKKLIQIIEKRTGKASQIFTNKSKEKRLYQEIVSGNVVDDQTAYSILYTKGEDVSGLKMIKSRLRKKLMNQLFFLDENNNGKVSPHSVEQNCLAKFYQARVFIDSGANDLALPILKKILSKSIEYDFNYISSLCLRSILQSYVNINERSLFYKVLQQLKNVTGKLEADQESEMLFMIANIELSHSVAARKNYLLQIDEVLGKMEQIWCQAQTFETFNNYYRLSIWLHELTGNFSEIVLITNQSSQLIQDNPIISRRFDERFNQFIQVYAHLRSKKLEEGLELANTYLSSFNPASNNWFAFMENYTLLAIHARKYLLGHGLLQQVQNNPFIKKINRLAQERWSLFEAYLHYVAPQQDQPFKWQALVQNAPTYSKDKEGFNVAILILQVMYYLDIADHEALEYRVESLKKYAQNHFKDTFSERSRAFFKLLTVMVRSDFDPVVTHKKGLYLYQKLQRTTPPGDAYAEIEIIPYEHLWELVLQRLQVAKPVRK
ncbi:hypothetical protein TH63_08680 [Rufibacter radiotolerans]|uniref:Uncharacterized protein n=1 Tax=Rufibacter radiotolerans TaxID=1379910 RepID=A0A0H4VPR2_9BACT|nr:hypothetical protein [Rufibacter radiotolerans]AKQ45709.1 hypothetical protein TH63_08680 [Rufibacter radiotolerans]